VIIRGAMHPILLEEQALLDDTRARLDRAPAVDPADEADILASLRRLQDDVRTAKTEDKAAIEQQYDQQLRLLDQLRKGRPDGGVDPSSPYFAHLRIQQDGRTSDILLGRATCLENGMRIVDWRHAPVARVYYRYEEGDSYEEELGPRTVEGQVLARRTLSIQSGELRRVDAPQGLFVRGAEGWGEAERHAPQLATGAGAVRRSGDAGRALGASSGRAIRADKHLPDIAALIDPSQFELIASPDSGPVVVRGGAGSGKTTVTLHRIAYLAYANPQRFAAHRMLFVVWGKALRDYVSMVLPNLGVPGVPVVTWSDWSRKLVQRHYPQLPGNADSNTPAVVTRFKLHPALPRLLEQRVRARRAPNNGVSALEDWRLLISDRSLMQQCGFTPSEVEQIAGWIRRQIDELARAIEEREKDAKPWLDEEDDAILLRAWQLRAGELRSKSGPVKYSHVAVDEVQDFSPMEIAVLVGCTDQRRCITLSGDTQQHISGVSGSDSWVGLLDAIGVPSTAVSSLKVSYRSTRSITAFARAVLGPVAEDDAPPLAAREGEPVEIFDFDEHGACVEFVGRALRTLLRAEPLASIAVLAPTMDLARLYHAGFGRMELPRLRLVEDQAFAFAPGVDVVDVSQVKGLEFDYVVLVDVGAGAYPDRPGARRLLHVGATRAVHQLWVTCVGAASPLLPDVEAAP
jgi:DNA helicase-2/ATP-dependent DNA helicase PcrA